MVAINHWGYASSLLHFGVYFWFGGIPDIVLIVYDLVRSSLNQAVKMGDNGNCVHYDIFVLNRLSYFYGPM